MSKTLKIFLSIALAVSLVGCGTAFAMMLIRSQTEENSFIPAAVSCKIEENFDGDKKTSITVENTGNIDAYIRVCFVTYWENESGEIVPKSSKVIPPLPSGDKWLAGKDNIYYYTETVAPEEVIEFVKSDEEIVLETDSETGYKQVLEVFAEAIQYIPEKAVEESWGVTIENGVITAVPTT